MSENTRARLSIGVNHSLGSFGFGFNLPRGIGHRARFHHFAWCNTNSQNRSGSSTASILKVSFRLARLSTPARWRQDLSLLVQLNLTFAIKGVY